LTPPLPVVCIFGPTAVGKTDLLVSLFPGKAEIISADSMQVYRGLDIGTAKPSSELRRQLPHHLIDIIEPSTQHTVGDFVRRADILVREILGRGKVPIISGGTAFYIKTFLYGLPKTPPASPDMRKQLQEEIREQGTEILYRELCDADPESGMKIAPGDAYRIIRAMEVIRQTGKPFSSFLPPEVPREEYSALLIGLNLEREVLYERINRRVELMFESGLVREIKNLIAAGYSREDPGLRGIGYKEFFEMERNGCLSMDQVRERIQQNSRRYAKRQLTFFKSMNRVSWFHPDDIDGILSNVRDFPF